MRFEGCFTQVSYAGKVVVNQPQPTSLENIGKEGDEPSCSSLKPVPSPRVKRKARKEKMLLEHKAMGKEALTKLLLETRNVTKVNFSARFKTNPI